MEITDFKNQTNEQISKEIQTLSNTLVGHVNMFTQADDTDTAYRMYKSLVTEIQKLSFVIAERTRRAEADKEASETTPKKPVNTEITAGSTVIWAKQGKDYECTVISVGLDYATVSFNGYQGKVPLSEIRVPEPEAHGNNEDSESHCDVNGNIIYKDDVVSFEVNGTEYTGTIVSLNKNGTVTVSCNGHAGEIMASKVKGTELPFA